MRKEQKDPAFLFYSRDFYEGTRTMLPEERACYMDLLIYQHQHGYIPNDIRRVLMYCSGIDEATLKATLKAKFKLCSEGWYNEVLQDKMSNRSDHKIVQSINGKFGQIMRKAKKLCSEAEYQQFREYFCTVIGKEKGVDLLANDEATLKGLLEASLKHYANANANANNIIKGVENSKTEILDDDLDFETPNPDTIDRARNIQLDLFGKMFYDWLKTQLGTQPQRSKYDDEHFKTGLEWLRQAAIANGGNPDDTESLFGAFEKLTEYLDDWERKKYMSAKNLMPRLAELYGRSKTTGSTKKQNWDEAFV